MSKKLPLWNRAASIENGTAGATNTAPASNMTSTKSLTCQRIAIGKEATSRHATPRCYVLTLCTRQGMCSGRRRRQKRLSIPKIVAA